MPRRSATFYEMLQHLSRNYDKQIDDLFPRGNQAIQIALSSIIDVIALGATIEPMRWFVTINSASSIAVEPRNIKRYHLEPGAHPYHVRIARSGIRL